MPYAFGMEVFSSKGFTLTLKFLLWLLHLTKDLVFPCVCE